MSNNLHWSNTTSMDEVARRAGGRRWYNSWRGFMRTVRRWKVLTLMSRYGLVGHGVLARIARELGVSRATVCRDRKALLRMGTLRSCPHCGKPVPPFSVELGVPSELLALPEEEPNRVESEVRRLMGGESHNEDGAMDHLPT